MTDEQPTEEPTEEPTEDPIPDEPNEFPPSDVGQWTMDNIFITAGPDDEKKSLNEWQSDPRELKTSAAGTEDGETEFEFEDPTGYPRDVVVFVNGRG